MDEPAENSNDNLPAIDYRAQAKAKFETSYRSKDTWLKDFATVDKFLQNLATINGQIYVVRRLRFSKELRNDNILTEIEIIALELEIRRLMIENTTTQSLA
ncbi:MAG: hypothetical protein V1936_02445 [Patescibacteria group bacterium]